MLYQSALEALVNAYRKLPTIHCVTWIQGHGFKLADSATCEGEPQVLIMSKTVPPVPLCDHGLELVDCWLELLNHPANKIKC